MAEQQIYYLYGKSSREFVERLRNDSGDSDDILFIPFDSKSVFPNIDREKIAHIIVTGTIQEIKIILKYAHHHSISIGIVPLANQKRFTKMFDLPSNPKEAFYLAKVPNEKKIDLLYCDDKLVINDIRIGSTSALKEFEYHYPRYSLIKRMQLFWQSLRHKNILKHSEFKLTTHKEESYKFSAIGMIILGQNNYSWISKIFEDKLSAIDGQQTFLILAPTSLLEYFIVNPLTLFLRQWGGGDRMLPSWGCMKSARTIIETPQSVKVVIDDEETINTPVTIETNEKALQLSVGEKFWQSQPSQKEDRSRVKLGDIPRDTESMAYFTKGLPLFRHASTQQYATLFANLREEGSVSSSFVVLLILATMIATLGLFINSGSVIIGAMLLAPLMQPIVSLSMGLLRQDQKLLQNAIKTISVGVSITLLTAMMIALLTPIERLGTEMASRLSPTLLDMFVAIASGIAAAYVKNNEKISSSLAGVAIAVALVPPLAVSGIGLGWGEWSMFMESLLLFTTNLIGIVLASAITFLIMGYAPIKVAKRGIMLWSLLSLLVALPLYYSFETMKERTNIQKSLSRIRFEINHKEVYLNKIEYSPRGRYGEVRCEVVVSSKLNQKEKEYLSQMIHSVAGKPTEIIVTFRYRL